MKTSQDFNENFNQYSSEIEKEMSNLNRMLQEFASNGVVAQQIINDLEPVLAKLHLTIDSFTMNRPDKEKASIEGENKTTPRVGDAEARLSTYSAELAEKEALVANAEEFAKLSKEDAKAIRHRIASLKRKIERANKALGTK